MNVLIADDNKMMRYLIKYYIEKYNFDVEEVSDGLELIKKYEEKKYDLLFLDISMPNLDGLEVIEYLKVKEYDVKIVMISAHIDSEMLSKLKEYDVQYFLNKPIEVTKFNEIVEEIIKIV